MKVVNQLRIAFAVVALLSVAIYVLAASHPNPEGSVAKIGPFMAALGSFFVAAFGLFAIVGTLQVQNQPVLILEIEPSDVIFQNGKLLRPEDLSKQVGLWFKFKNVGNSPAIVRRFNRQWKIVTDYDELSSLKRLSLYGEHAKDTMMVVPTGGTTDFIKTAIRDKINSTCTLYAQENYGLGTKPVFMVSVEYEDLLGHRYISHMTHIVADGKFHQIQTGRDNARLNSYERKRRPYQS